jgi:hypothetical protein
VCSAGKSSGSSPPRPVGGDLNTAASKRSFATRVKMPVDLGSLRTDTWRVRVKWLNRATAVSVVIFLVAMTQAAFYQNRPAEPVTHAVLLLATGWMGVLIGYLEWIANPLILYSWTSALRKRVVPALLASTSAAGLILSFLLRKKMDWPGMETDTNPDIQGYAAGYWLWLVSALVMVVASGIELVLGQRKTKIAQSGQSA